jgi:hypothetical protein
MFFALPGEGERCSQEQPDRVWVDVWSREDEAFDRFRVFLNGEVLAEGIDLRDTLADGRRALLALGERQLMAAGVRPRPEGTR